MKITPRKHTISEEEIPQISFNSANSNQNKYDLVTDEALSRRQIHIIDEVTDTTFEQVKNVYDELVELDPEAPIHFIVGTNGGDVRSMLGLMNLVLLSKTPCYTYLLGETCSAGSWFYLCGHKRFAADTPFISFMLHPVEWEKGDSLGNHKSHQDYVQKLSDNLLEFTASRTLLTKKYLKSLISVETKYFIGHEIFDKGIATDKLTTSSFWLATKKASKTANKEKNKKLLSVIQE